MKFIIDLMVGLGDHFLLILVGCLEAAVAAVYAGKVLGRNAKLQRRRQREESAETTFLTEFDKKTDECCIVLERKEKLPVYASGNLESLTGLTLRDLQQDLECLGRKSMEPGKSTVYWKKYLAWDGAGRFECEIPMQDGRTLAIFAERDGACACDLITLRDVTGYRQQIEDYRKRLTDVEEASQSKTTFLSRMSHEIRTPMNGIIGMLTLAEGKLAPGDPAREYLTKANELSDHLLSLINDILDMSRIEAGKVELEEKAFSLRALGQKLYDMFAKNLESRGIQYAVNFEEITVDYVLGDELRLSQVIINFLSNAVKFTEKGEITVTFRQMMEKDGVADMMIRVHDTGKGMEAEFINRIFRPFEQESLEISHTYGGTGLGMAITDSLVRIMGGEIVVESIPGKGSDFSVFLHLPVAEEAKKEEECRPVGSLTEAKTDASNAFRNRRILMAEDNELNAMIAKEILESMGASVDVADNGRMAVELFMAHPENHYDFILMDVQMPVMDGREACRTIRALDRPDAGSILIFGLSADAFVEDERLSLESGMNGHYAKPVDYEALRENVGKYLQESQGR